MWFVSLIQSDDRSFLFVTQPSNSHHLLYHLFNLFMTRTRFAEETVLRRRTNANVGGAARLMNLFMRRRR